MRPIAAAASLLTVTGTALAQSGVATYSIAFGSPAGQNTVVLQPGESTSVFVNVSFSPGVGSGIPPVLGLSDGVFSISGAGSGGGLWAVDPTPSSPTYSLPYPWGFQAVGGSPAVVGTAGPGGVAGVHWGYGFFFSPPHPYPQNPANVWHGTFTASSEGVIDATFVSLGSTGVFFYGGIPGVMHYTSLGQAGQITIVPAPAALSLLACAVLLAARRSTRRHGAA